MYEATVSVSKDNSHLLDYVKSQINSYISDVDGISTETNDETREFYSVACADTFRFQAQRCLINAVGEALSRGYKNVYLRGILRIDDKDFFQNVLVNTICVFDSDIDMQSITRILDAEKPLYLDGYYNFRLSALKKKWTEISKLVSDNNFILSDKDLILEFLQYLLESVNSKIKQLSVCFNENDFTLYGTNNKVISKSLSLAKSVSVEEEAMLNAICLKPQTVKVYAQKSPSDAFCEMMDALFDAQYILTE